MIRYIKLLGSFVKTSFMADIEYRLNMVTKLLSDLVWYVAQLSVFEVLFTHIPNLAGWDLHGARLLMVILFFVDMFYMIFFSENLGALKDLAKNGELDLLLAKPLNTQFIVSLRKVNTTYFVNLLFLVGYFVWAYHQMPSKIEPWRLFLLLVLIPSAVIIIYSISFMLNCLAIIFTKADYVTYLWYQIYRFGQRPDTIYPPWLRYILLSLLPTAFIASVPTRLLIFAWDPLLFAAAVLWPLFFLWLTSRVWEFSLRRYSSASS